MRKGDDAPDQVGGRSVANPTIFYFFQTWSGASCQWSGAGPEQVFSGPAQVWGKFSCRYQTLFCVKFSKMGGNELAIDGRWVVVELSGSLATPYSLLKNFQLANLTFPVRQTFSIYQTDH